MIRIKSGDFILIFFLVGLILTGVFAAAYRFEVKAFLSRIELEERTNIALQVGPIENICNINIPEHRQS